MSEQLWEWWEGRLTREQRDELMACGREALPPELVEQVQQAAAGLGFAVCARGGVGSFWHLTEAVARFVGARQYERVHPDDYLPHGLPPEVSRVWSGRPTTPARVELLHTEDCSNWAATAVRLSIALQVTGRDDTQTRVRRITTPEEAALTGFTGSPMVLFDGVDPFAEPGLGVGLSCRLYRDGDDIVGAPTVGQLVDALLACERP